jgi:methionine-rich copper-binding protein CopC
MRLSRLLGIPLLATLIGVVVHPQLAFGHTKLISSQPQSGITLQSWPTKVVLDFDQPLIQIGNQKSNLLVVHNAVGDQVSLDNEVIRENSISVSLGSNAVKGPALVYYRVVSSDGHPVEGEYSFIVANQKIIPSEAIITPDPKELPISIYIASAAFITSGIFFAIYSYRRRSRE